ncbi:hypothetical protein BJ322DRAFT_729829 [Thelephora terrestris]|uniref:PIN domain-like protein n=1 Tax=Thelephora terrestris TaxID=56493 RepID=A0A9P6L878_9AGAM|nr:hypothetical protein BJ322DRAFT_729829 [Thelephora terrestris]
MGVKSLWKLLTPVGRPVLLETLEGKILAIDSSIWIYQFQATMRDKDGRVILNAHILGFLRRICKLLFWGIKPVFVFDGGVPVLKRSTINERRRRKEGAATTHAKVAERLLAAQMRREAVDQAQGRGPSSKGKSVPSANQVDNDDENAVYFEDLDPSFSVGKPSSTAKPQSSTKPRFYDHDPYRLPDMDFDSKITEASRSTVDPRLATAEEMQSFISEMAPSDFDLTSETFRSLPTEVQYEIIGDLRLKSRQTSFKRLQNMLKNSETPLDFSKEQIKGLKERNRLTQKLLTTTDTMGKANVEIPIRIAGERNRQYVLVKNEGEGKGWILGMRDAGTRDQPIIVDDPSRDGVKPKEARDQEREQTGNDDDMDTEEVAMPTHSPSPRIAVVQDRDLRRYRSRTALAAVGKRHKTSDWTSLAKSTSGIFPRRPSGSKLRAKTVETPLFVPDEEDDVVPQVVEGSEADEWEDFNEELEEDVQMSIAIAESLESQHRFRSVSDPRPLAQAPILGTPIKPPKKDNTDNGGEVAADDEDDFTSPSRLETQLVIAGARKPLSTRISSGSTRGTAGFSNTIPSASPKKPALIANQPLDQSPDSPREDDMEEITIPHATTIRPHIVLEPLINSDLAPVVNVAETPLAIGVEDAVAKRFAEFQKIFAEKRKAFRAENLEVQEEVRQTRGGSRASSPGLEYVDVEVGVIEAQERERGATGVRSSPPPQSDEDEDMEEVEIVVAPPPVLPQLPVGSKPNAQPPAPSIHTVLPSKRIEEKADEDEEDVPISDWSRSPSPRLRSPAGETVPSTSVLTLDRSRGLLDADDSFDQGLPGERDQEHEDFDAAREMDPDAEAGEFARWISQVKGRNLDDVRKEIEQEINGLRKEQKAAMRDSEDITSQMIAQIMMILRLFGIPYITAPMEAEAQCAELVRLGLVEGIITDDSDVFLFGGNRVFRNMFNQSKTVECFLSSDLVRELGLDRGTLVRLAYLLGSDYTEGLAGVGPVVAMELVKEFPGDDGLEKFTEWWSKVQSGRDKKEESRSHFRRSFVSV